MKKESRKLILIVDDNKTLLKMLSDFMTFKGFDVVVAETGEEALEKIATNVRPDIILLDISMPGMGGIGFLRRIMLSNGTMQYPVLVFTARATTEDYFRGVPVDGFVAKPCDKVLLVSKIEEILEKHKNAARKTVLLGEDDPVVAGRLVKAFQNVGFEVEEAATGAEVVEKAVVCLPDAVLMRQVLTGMNGDSVAAILQAMPRTQSIPVVLYDESRVPMTKKELDSLRHKPGIKKCLETQETADLLDAVKEVLHVTGRAAE